MRYSPELYAKAFLETVAVASGKKQPEMLFRFVEVIRKNGDSPLIKKIFRQVQEAIIKKQGAKIITLEFAREIPKALVAKLRNYFSKKDHIKQVIREDLVAGVRVLVDNEKELDLTMRKKLKKLFNAI